MNAQNILKISVLAAAMGMVSSGAFAADNDDQTITYEVTAINEIAVSGNPGNLTVSTATAGSQPDAVTDDSTTYAITTNGTNKRITAALDEAMPANVTLSLTATAPAGGASSSGKVALTASAQSVVTGITQVAESEIGLEYELSATVAAGIVASDTVDVTLTIADAG
ncbi:hypothetical protein [Thiococcus pfennigii]|uniref:hypothetical protein n=1 Tax=Thiococcus pfennigii TaxID=1057 RepID=UPI0019080E8A|nr:hypothetical protein [Thiococcus pfennigii]MBK1701750.1 hypothetical protein [Thiococcus pfennigii]